MNSAAFVFKEMAGTVPALEPDGGRLVRDIALDVFLREACGQPILPEPGKLLFVYLGLAVTAHRAVV